MGFAGPAGWEECVSEDESHWNGGAGRCFGTRDSLSSFPCCKALDFVLQLELLVFLQLDCGCIFMNHQKKKTFKKLLFLKMKSSLL